MVHTVGEFPSGQIHGGTGCTRESEPTTANTAMEGNLSNRALRLRSKTQKNTCNVTGYGLDLCVSTRLYTLMVLGDGAFGE